MFKPLLLRLSKGESVTVPIDEILFISSFDHLCRDYRRNKENPVTISMAIGDFFTGGLPKEQFCMVHRSYIVNMHALKHIEGRVLILEENYRINCGRSAMFNSIYTYFLVFPPLA